MMSYILKQREGQFLLIGTILLVLGFISFTNPVLSRLFFYAAIFFLGFFATKDAVIETLKDKSPNVDLLMVLAAIGALLIGYESEGAMLLFIFAGAEFLEDFAMNKSTRAIEELMGQVPDTAQLLKENGDVVEVPTSQLSVGQVVVVAKGAQLPIDGYLDRTTTVNEAALTGESLPVEKEKGEEVFAGTINEGNSIYLTVSKTSKETVFSNIVRMVEEAQSRPSQISRMIDRLESKYVIGVLLAVPVFIILLMLIGSMSFQDAFYRGMVLLTVASPCALVASATPAALSAISNGAKNGILFKGGAAMEALNTMDILLSDKTGTLTFGEFKVVDYQVPEQILKEVVFMEQTSSHPIAEAISTSYSDLSLDSVDQNEMVEEIVAVGMQKGDIVVGKPSYFDTFNDPNGYRKQVEQGYTTIFVGQGQEIVGYLVLADQVRSEAKYAVRQFQKEGVDVQLITGDNPKVAKLVSDEVGIKSFQASCLPEDKIKRVQTEHQAGHVVGVIGDGINDAPALAGADIGIAMGSGSSVAMESADVVIVKNNLAKLFYSYELSGKLNRIIKQNILFSISVIVILVILNIIGILDLPMGVVFHEGSTILVILNGLRLLAEKDTQENKHQESAEVTSLKN